MSAVHWFCVSYAGFALATYCYIGSIMYRDEYYSPSRAEMIVFAVFWPLFWGTVAGFLLYDRTREWKERMARNHEQKRGPVRAGRREEAGRRHGRHEDLHTRCEVCENDPFKRKGGQ